MDENQDTGNGFPRPARLSLGRLLLLLALIPAACGPALRATANRVEAAGFAHRHGLARPDSDRG